MLGSALLILIALFMGLPEAWAAVQTSGEDDAAPRGLISLSEAYETARRQNPALQAARLGADVARGEKLQLAALQDPVLVWEFDEARNLSPAAFGDQKIGIVQFLEFPGKRGLRGSIGEDEIEIQRRRAEVFEAFVLRDVAASYWRLARTGTAIATLEESRELLQQFAEITRSKYETNAAPYTDVVRTQLELARLDNELISLRRERRTQRIRLNLLLGNASDSALETADSVRYEPVSESWDSVLLRRLDGSQTLAVARLRNEQGEKRLRLAAKSNLPDFGIGAFYQRVNAGSAAAKSFFGAELSLNLPLWRTRQRGESLAARARLDISRVGLTRLEARVEGDVRTAWEVAQEADQRVAVFETRLLGEAEDAVQSAIGAYQYNQIDALDLIDLYRTAKDVQLQYLVALENHLIARARLEFSGEILDFE